MKEVRGGPARAAVAAPDAESAPVAQSLEQKRRELEARIAEKRHAALAAGRPDPLPESVRPSGLVRTPSQAIASVPTPRSPGFPVERIPADYSHGATNPGCGTDCPEPHPLPGLGSLPPAVLEG